MAPRYRGLVAAAGAIAYIAVAQWLMTRTPPSAWAAVALLGPMLGLMAIGCWRSGRRGWSVAAAAGVVALVSQVASGRSFAPEHLYLLQHVLIHLGLAFAFGISLRGGSRPLIARLAERVHRGLTPTMERYIRKVTVAWTLYFGAVAALSLGIYAAAPFPVWATFANLGTPALLGLMFVGEHVLRYRLHPEFERATLQDAIAPIARTARTGAAPAPPPRRPHPCHEHASADRRDRPRCAARLARRPGGVASAIPVDVSALARRLPVDGAVLNLTADRYRFAVGLGAAMCRGHTSLLPPNHTADTVARLRAMHAGSTPSSMPTRRRLGPACRR
jgi:uncharacterized membrane protein